MTSCKGCPIELICQNKANPLRTCNRRIAGPAIRNGYAAMARQEQTLRMDAISFAGDFDA